MNENDVNRKVSIALVSILIVILMLLMAYTSIARGEEIPYPPDNDKCDRPYILKWMVPNCIYCEGIGDYYLFSCYDSGNTNLIYKSVCVYPTGEGDTIPPSRFNYLPMIYGMDVITGDPISK